MPLWSFFVARHVFAVQIKLLQVSGEGSVAVTGQCLAAVRAMLRHWVQVSDDLLQSLSRRKETSDVSGFPHICMGESSRSLRVHHLYAVF